VCSSDLNRRSSFRRRIARGLSLVLRKNGGCGKE